MPVKNLRFTKLQDHKRKAAFCFSFGEPKLSFFFGNPDRFFDFYLLLADLIIFFPRFFEKI